MTFTTTAAAVAIDCDDGGDALDSFANPYFACGDANTFRGCL